MLPTGLYIVLQYYRSLEAITVALGCIILVLSVDDLFVDAWFWCRECYRAIFVRPRYTPLTADQLHDRAEKPFAIMVPAWLEYDVIAPMLENMVATLDYENYRIFVGTYVNDQATIDEVERARRRIRRIVRVEVPHDGPTCKADCLNWLIQAILLYERENDMQFAGIVMHDSEDVLHPLELRLFNYILPRKDFIQIPVASLERRCGEWIAGTYMDEFAEWHARDLIVRESLSGMVPSAGVGTCISRHAIGVLAAETDNQPFSTETLTEDYDIGARLAQHGMTAIFCRFPVDYTVQRPTWFGLGPVRTRRLRVPLCVREYFPNAFRPAFRQKARWTLGICFQGWQQVGWTGSLATKYLLFRDRKGIVTAFINVFGYLVSLQLILFWLAAAICGWGDPRIVSALRHDWVRWLLYANGAVLLWRVSQRMYFVRRLYGWQHSILSVPRMVVANLINFMAAARAWRIFLGNLLFGTRIVWDKTMHEFPSSASLVRHRQKLGELLLAWQAVDAEHLTHALDQQRGTSVPLGRVLVANGVLDEETLAEAIAFQANLPRAHPTEQQLRQASGAIPAEICLRWRVVPFGSEPDGRLKLATAGPATEHAQMDISRVAPHGTSWFVVRESEITRALRHLRSAAAGSAVPCETVPVLGDLLLELGLVMPDRLTEAVRDYHPDRHGRIGDFLVAQSVLTREMVEQAVREQQTLMVPVPVTVEGRHAAEV